MAKYLFFKLASLVVPLLPMPVAYGLGWLAGELAFHVAAGPRRAARCNLRHVLGPAAPSRQLTQAVRGVFHTVAYNYIDMFRLPLLRPTELAERVDIRNVDLLLREYAKGKGIIIATCHLGNFDLLLQISAAYHIPVTPLVERLEPPALHRLVLRLRGSHGLHLVPAAPSALREIFRVLRGGGVVAIAVDRDLQHRGVPVPFFGEATRLPTGAIELALHTGASLLPIFGLRLPNGRYQISIEPPLELDREGPQDQVVARNLGRLVPILEQYIGAHPEQWIVFEPLWDQGTSPNPTQGAPAAEPLGARR
jgi:KDO2-lipid IV(A) lauroyltransferase